MHALFVIDVVIDLARALPETQDEKMSAGQRNPTGFNVYLLYVLTVNCKPCSSSQKKRKGDLAREGGTGSSSTSTQQGGAGGAGGEGPLPEPAYAARARSGAYSRDSKVQREWRKRGGCSKRGGAEREK